MIKTILVCEAHLPFVHGGAELHVRLTWDGVVECLVDAPVVHGQC